MSSRRVALRQARLAYLVGDIEVMQLVVRTCALDDSFDPSSRRWRIRLKVQHNIEAGPEKLLQMRSDGPAQPCRGTNIIVDRSNFAGIKARQKFVLAHQDSMWGIGERSRQ